ncbi:MAG: biotin--[acetyl-CoA-carboxylase] ligase [Magnetococcales bacterium]|nr:biotin--[acetyl-CoA-carboxylase] ligase [Magnetococcales bacterium]
MNAAPPDHDTLRPERMAPLWRGRLFAAERYHYHERIGSTNQEAMQLARAGAPEGTLVVAEGQSGGRGRLGRVWESPSGENLYLSMVLRPDLPVAHAPRLTLVAGLATVEAVLAAGVAEARLKWPNDVLVNGRKLAGILTEMATEGERIRQVTVGVGVNVNGRSADFSPEVAARAVTMADILHRTCERAELLAALLVAMERWYARLLTEGFAPIRIAWKEWALLEGQRVRVESATGSREGWLEDLDEEGFLLVRGAEGEIWRVLAGDVVLV